MSAISDTLFDSTLVPLTKKTDFGFGIDRFIHGVIDSKGVIKDFYSHMRRGRSFLNEDMRNHYIEGQQRADRISGRWLYAGGLFPHFGHFLAECIHRLWRLDDDKSFAGVIYLTDESISSVEDLPQPIQKVLKFLLRDTPILFVNSLTRVDELVVPKPGAMLQAFRYDWYMSYQMRLLKGKGLEAINLPDSFKPKVYVSRYNYRSVGRVFGLNYLQSILLDNGYFIFNPEEHEFNVQLRVIQCAERVIWEEGSAIHLLELFGVIDSDQYLICRRPSFPMFKRLLSQKSSKVSVFEDVVTLPDVNRVDDVAHNSMSIIRCPRALFSDLYKTGFILNANAEVELFYRQEITDILEYINGNLSSAMPDRLELFNDSIVSVRSIDLRGSAT